MRNTMILAAALVAATATSAAAQGRGRNTDGVPPGMRPPAGMCRVWINGVPPGQQPGVTDCTTARLQVPANGRVLYGGGTALVTNRTYSHRRQLSDGSWVLDRYRRDAAGNVTLISSNPLATTNVTTKAQVKAQRKLDKQEMKTDKKEWKDENKSENKSENKDWKGNKGKKDKGNEQENGQGDDGNG